MCGRYTLRTPSDLLVAIFGLEAAPTLVPRWNIAPTQKVPVVRAETGARGLEFVSWGLVPKWAKDTSIAGRLINARSETVAVKPSFREALRKRRCLVPADGFYEWKAAGKSKLPFHFSMKDESPFAMAGLWERWVGPDGGVLESCALVTTQANERVRPVHDRMPAILSPEDFATWLDPQVTEASRLTPMLVPFEADRMKATAVERNVNNARFEGPDCLTPAKPA